MKGEAQQAIVRLLSLMRDGKEIRQYLQRFSEIERTRFAVIKVGGAVLRDDRAVLADALAFLQTVGLTPVVVHGAGPQLDAALDEKGVSSVRVGGLRVTTPEVMAVAREVFTAENLALVDAVRAAGARAAAVPYGVFEAELADEARLGLVGEPRMASLDLVRSATNAGAIPILASLGVSPEGRLLNVNADAAVRALVAALEPTKVVFLTQTGGVLNGEGGLVTSINLATDRETLMRAPWLTGGMRLKIEEIERLLEALPLSSSVSITRPDALAQELFTHTGSGTLVRRGESVLVGEEKSAFELGRVVSLVTDAFGRPPAPQWWEQLALARGYVTERYRAGAFVCALEGAAYLDKFAVCGDAQGEGLGQAVWRRMTADWPRLIWRAHPDNPINDFYFREADGACRCGDWVVFWRGLNDFNDIARLVDVVSARPATLEAAA